MDDPLERIAQLEAEIQQLALAKQQAEQKANNLEQEKAAAELLAQAPAPDIQREFILRMMENMKEIADNQERRADAREERERARTSADKIKPLELKNFDGDTTKFHYFRTCFKAAFENHQLTNPMLALHLQSHLRGEALALIEGDFKTRLDDKSYEDAWEKLDQRFGGKHNEDQFIFEQFKECGDLKDTSLKELERFYDVFRRQNEYYLRKFPEMVTNEVSLLMKGAQQKFTPEQGTKFIEYCERKGKPNNFASMLDWIKEMYLIAQETDCAYRHKKFEAPKEVARDSDSDNSDNEETNFWVERVDNKFKISFENPQKGITSPDSSVFFNAPTTSRTKFKITLKPKSECSLCKIEHQMAECPKFPKLSVENRYNLVKKETLCWHCLSSHHYVRDCRKAEGRRCGVGGCSLLHHKLIHMETSSKDHFEYQPVPYGPLDEDEERSLMHIYSGDIVNYVAGIGAIAIQTIVLKVSYDKKQTTTVALIDTGSNVTFIDEDLAKSLNLPTIKERKGQTLSYMDRTVEVKGKQFLVEAKVSSMESDRSRNIEAWTVKGLASKCGIVDWSERKFDFPHLKKINFPKLPPNPKIDILFGTNMTFMFASDKTFTNPDNHLDPIAMRTPLGWTCIGKSSKENNDSGPKKAINCFKSVLFGSPASQSEI